MTAPTTSGSGNGGADAGSEGSAEQEWPGQRLGLPESGPGSVAGWGRRMLALFIDWMLCLLVVSVITGRRVWEPLLGWERWLPLLTFALEATVLTALLGGSAGQLIVRVGVRRLGGGLLDPWRALIRALLICLVIPPVIYNRDQRGLHDLATDSVAVRR